VLKACLFEGRSILLKTHKHWSLPDSSLALHIKQFVHTLFMGDIARTLCVVCSCHTNSIGASLVFV